MMIECGAPAHEVPTVKDISKPLLQNVTDKLVAKVISLPLSKQMIPMYLVYEANLFSGFLSIF